MKKVLFFALLLVIFGAANVNSQVRIGGDGEPHTSAVLDLNTDDSDTPTENKGALALPRVSLATNTDELNGATPLAGMLVYNTNVSMMGGDGIGVYYWDGSQWVKSVGIYEGSTSITLSGNSFQRAELTGDITAPANSNETTIANNAVTSNKIASGAVGLTKLNYLYGGVTLTVAAAIGSVASAALPSGCSINNTAISQSTFQYFNCGWYDPYLVGCIRTAASPAQPTVQYLCMRS